MNMIRLPRDITLAHVCQPLLVESWSGHICWDMGSGSEDTGIDESEKYWVFCFCLFDLIVYVPVNNLTVMSGQVFLG